MPMRTSVFIDGQNLYRLAMRAYGRVYPYYWPSYDVVKLANALVSRVPERTLTEVRFYTGVPSESQSADWHGFWNNKLRHLQRQEVRVYRQELSAAGQEKGVDVRLAVELVQATYEQLYDVAIIVSQDADLAPAVAVARDIAQGQNRSVAFESAFPRIPGRRDFGIPDTTWVPIDKATYDTCLDLSDYRPPRS